MRRRDSEGVIIRTRRGAARPNRPAVIVWAAVAGFAAAAAMSGRLGATPPPLPGPASTPDVAPSPGSSPLPGARPPHGGFFTGISRRGQLLGTLGGVRPALSKYGITLGASETSEELGNVAGGTRRGFDYDGLTQMVLQVDTQRAFGVRGGTFDASALQIHGSNLSANNLGTLQTASGIEADRATRLWELWYQQQLRRDGRLDVKIGQQSLDQEFMVSQNALLFVNTMFGWPMLPSADLPGGGPAYPLSALGVRVRAKPSDSLTLLGGVFNGSPTAVAGGDSQMTDASGTSFPLHGGALAIAELQYAYPGLGALVYPGRKAPLSRTVRVGFWYDSDAFDDLAVDATGGSLANPASSGVARSHRGDYAAYGVIDQQIFQSTVEADRTLGAFARIMGTPLGDRNLIAFSANLGLSLHDPIFHREDDVFGLGLGYTKVSAAAANVDARTATFARGLSPVRNGETFVEATYQYQLYPWLQLQPDVQYVFHPGANVVNSSSPTQRIGNEAVFGIRTIVQL